MSDERSLEKYLRGNVWWVRGARPDTGRYIRESLGTSDEELAQTKVEEIYREARKRRLLGPDAPKPEDELTFAGAALLYPVKGNNARFLKPIIRRYGKTLVRDMTPAFVRGLGPKLYPTASTDTWQRQVVIPVRAVINNAHDLGKYPHPIRVKAYSKDERIRQDRLRGKVSRVEKSPGSWEWLLAFCAVADPRDAALARFMFTKGARIGQSLAMERDKDMDLSARKLRLPATKGHPEQWVDIDQTLAVMIANLPVPYRGNGRNRVFTMHTTGHAGALYRRWKAACKRAGIPYLSPHAAGRHGFGTEMIVRQKVDPVTAAEQGRWADPSVMLKTYSHAEGAAATVADAMASGERRAKGNN